MAASGKRSFWLHQLAEYIVGGAMLASGLQSPKPLIPAIVGSLILLNTAIVDAPFGAFRLVGRRLHRILDYIVLGIATVACAAPGMDVATRLVQILIVIVLAVVILRTNYSAPAPKGKQPVSAVPDGRADEIGRLAGHTAGTWASKIREKESRVQTTMNKPPKKSAPKPKRFKLPDGTGLVVWTDPIGTGSFAALVIKGGRLEVVDFDGSTMVYDFANAYDAIFPLLVAHTTMSEETAFHVLFCEKYNEKQARGVVQQILRLVGRERFEKQNFDVRWSDGRAHAIDLLA